MIVYRFPPDSPEPMASRILVGEYHSGLGVTVWVRVSCRKEWEDGPFCDKKEPIRHWHWANSDFIQRSWTHLQRADIRLNADAYQRLHSMYPRKWKKRK